MSLKTLFAPHDMTEGAPWQRITEFAVPMLIGNGYYPGHAEIAFDIVRREEKLRKYLEERYCK